MIRRLIHHLYAFLFLAIGTVVYQNVVTPMTEAPEVASVAPKSVAAGTTNDEAVADLFTADAWQRGNCKKLQSSTGMLMYSHWERISDVQWKLWPVSVVLGRGLNADPTADPVILDAPEGAEITFTESLDMLSGGAPPISNGRLIGKVEIRRNDSEDAKNSIRIRTANVGIDSRKVWTTEAIEMNLGQAEMIGRDLTIHFSGPTVSGPGRSAGGSETVLDRMELIYLDQMVMPLEKGGLLKSDPNQRAELSVQCGGRVEYDFALDELVLRDSVSFLHAIDGKPADQFLCDTLLLKLRDPTNDSLRRDTPLDWVNRIVATGQPARAILPSFDAELAASVLDFDAISGLIHATGQRTGVRVKRGGIDATLAQLTYQFDPNRPKSIGLINVQGAGIVRMNDPEVPLTQITWRDGFKLQPTQPTTAKDFDANVELFVDGDISAKLSDGGEFHAEAVEGVMKPKKTVQPDGKESIMLVPEWFRAVGDVSIDTSALAAQTKTLDLLFVEPIPGQSRSRSPSSSNAIRQWVNQPGQGRTVDPVARPRPVIQGESIAAKLRLDTEGVSANDMSVRGAIKVTHVLKAGDQLLPAILTGERLRLINGGTDDVLQLESSPQTPARFELGDGYFVGPMIQILPNENLIRINAAGEFQMPTAALPTNLAGNEGSSIEWVQAPNCHWNGEMFFDGRTAVLTDGVDVKASLITDEGNWDLHMQGDRLQVDLAQAVEVRDMDSMKTATIQRIALLQSKSTPVIVQALRRADDGVLEAKHLLHASVLALTPGNDGLIQAGQLVGRGPGWYRGWTIPSDNGSLLPLGGSKKTGRTVPKQNANKKLTGIHLVFHDSMRGDLAAKTLEFLRGVRVGVRAVAHWNDTFDAATMDAISMGDSTLDCDRLSFAVTPQPKKPPSRLFPDKPSIAWEMEAVSGVVFRTRNERGLLEGTASRASYASAKDLFTVEGAPNRAAIFRQTLPNGRKGHEGAVRTMTLRPSTMEVKNMQWERLNIATPPELSGQK